MKKQILLAILLTLLINPLLWAQSKTILDSKIIGGFCNSYFDLKENGMAFIFNKIKDLDEGTMGKATSTYNNVIYFTKDMSRRASFRFNSTGQVSIHATKNNLIAIDRVSTVYSIRVYDIIGKELINKKIDIGTAGLSQDMVSKLHFTAGGKIIFEVYDGQLELHLFSNNLLNAAEPYLNEIDIPFPSANPLQNMNYVGNWAFLGETNGYYILSRKGANAEFDPNAIAYHVAFYDEDFQLFRELLLDNFLLPGEQMMGKEAALSLNSTLQSFVVSCLMVRGGKVGLLVANYGMNANSSVMSLFWHKEFALLENEKYKFVENDGMSVPLPPVISNRGSTIDVGVVKGRTSVNEEAINQLLSFDAQGNNTFNAIQMGAYEMLNLDGYCVDNNNYYSRIKKLQMSAMLKPYCEQSQCEALDINIDGAGNELAIIKDGKNNLVTIFQMKAKY